MNTITNTVHVSARFWTAAIRFHGIVLALIGAWVATVALVGPYFSFEFDTSHEWVMSERHWVLSIGPGLALAIAGVLVARGGVDSARLGSLLALVAGIWLVAGPFLYGIWSSETHVIGGADWKRALLWIGWYVGAGAAAVALASYVLGLLARQRFAGSVLVDAPLEIVETQVQQPVEVPAE
jgi:hypothetical protein